MFWNNIRVNAIAGMPPAQFFQMFMTLMAGLATLAVVILFLVRKRRRAEEDRVRALIEDRKPKVTAAPSSLVEHTNQVSREVITVCQGRVHSAVGYGCANTILIEGTSGCVLLDTMETCEAMSLALSDLEERVDLAAKPIVAVIITHAHRDHTGGGKVIEDRFPRAKVYCHESMVGAERGMAGRLGGFAFRRASKQFGSFLPDGAGEKINVGIGTTYSFKTFAPVSPTATVSSRLTISPDPGLTLELFHAPGESEDQLAVFWPEQSALFPADNIYRTFPNLNLEQWCGVLDGFLSLKPKVLIPQHTKPVQGGDQVREVITAYRDAIQFVHDQTIRLMNKGLTPLELSQTLRLPSTLRSHPYLLEHYGTVEWSARAVHNQYLGWFSGDVSQMRLQMSAEERGQKLVELAGGKREVVETAKKSMRDKEVGREELRWALKLLEAVLAADEGSKEEKEAMVLKAKCLRRLATFETSAGGRNLMFTSALETDVGKTLGPSQEIVNSRLMRMSMSDLFWSLQLSLDAEKVEEHGVEIEEARFVFTDTGEDVTLKLRGPVLDFYNTSEAPPSSSSSNSVHMETTSVTWRAILTKETGALAQWARGNLKVKSGGFRGFAKFMGYLDRGL